MKRRPSEVHKRRIRRIRRIKVVRRKDKDASLFIIIIIIVCTFLYVLIAELVK